MLHTIKRTLAALTLTILVGVSGAAVYSRATGGHLLSVQTGSMVPVINTGDLVSVTRVSASDIREGDIVTFINPANAKQTITHRVVALPSTDNGQKFVTKGDANQSADQPVDQKAIVGRVQYHLPLLGYAIDTVRNPIGLALIIYLPALSIIIAEMKKLAAYYKSQEVYRLPWRKGRAKSNLPIAQLLPLVLVVPLIMGITVFAQLRSTAELSGNTISAQSGENQGCAEGGNTTTISIGQSTGGVVVTNTNRQITIGGNASSNGVNVNSGSVSNCNQTTVIIN